MRKKLRTFIIMTLALLLALSACAGQPAEEKPAEPGTEVTEPEKPADAGAAVESAVTSFRLATDEWLTDEAFAASSAWLEKYAAAIDEITVCCDQPNSPYMDDAMLDQYSTVLTGRVKALRDMGFESVGLYMQQTVGDSDFGASRLPTSTIQAAVDSNGNSSDCQLCPRTDKFKEYITKKYAAFAGTDPDFIVLGDDIYAFDKDVCFTCFCNRCVSAFNEENDTVIMRGAITGLLADATISGDAAKDMRLKWSSFNLKTYCELMGVIKDAVAGVDPDIKMGLTTIPDTADAYLLSDFKSLSDALGATKVCATAQFYTDDFLRTTASVGAKVAGQTVQLFDIADRQYSVDDYPETGYKSAKTHMVEATSAIMAGANGVMFSNIAACEGSDYIMDEAAKHTDMWDDMAKVGGTWKLRGATVAFNDRYSIETTENYFSNTANGYFEQVMPVFQAGFMSYSPDQENCPVTVLTGDMVSSLSDEEIKAIFSKGVMMDGAAAHALLTRNYDSLVGCSRASYYEDMPVEEYYTDHALNEGVAGSVRYTFGLSAYNFKLLEGTEPLTLAYNVLGELGDPTSYAYVNELGGRVVVFGYMPWVYFDIWQRAAQTANIVDWLSDGKMPVKVLNETCLTSYFKQPEDGSEFMLMLINAITGDTEDEIKVRILGEYDCDFVYYDEDGVKTTITADKAVVADGYTTVTLPGMTGWGSCVLYTATAAA